ncbi:hypothetical protein [Citrobacter amalonaticus]|nr:hypothetical protein [Citrobacter amalonaticus]
MDRQQHLIGAGVIGVLVVPMVSLCTDWPRNGPGNKANPAT